MKKKAIVETWDDSDKESTDEEQPHDVSNMTLITIGDESLMNLVR